MNLRLAWEKLRADGPRAVAARLLHRRLALFRARRRRRRWHDPKAAEVRPEAVPSDWSPRGAESLWPGAADRSWLADAPRRWPDLHAEAAARAHAAARGTFDLLGSGPVSVVGEDGRIRWHEDFKSGAAWPADRLYLDVPVCLPEEGTDIKVPWELSRFQHVFAFLWTDPARYGPAFLDQWRDWLEANPVGRGPNWACTMDVALRAVSWTAALAAWGREWDEATCRAMAAALATDGHFVRDNLEWAPTARTNHYYTDLVGLAVLGVVLRPYGPAAEWLAFAAAELREETPAQFASDGFNRECSTAYHGLVLKLALLGDHACRVGGHNLGQAVRERIAAACRAVAVLADGEGRIPLVGDNDSGRLFPVAWREDGLLGYLATLGGALLGEDDLVAGEAPPELALLAGPAALDGAGEAGGAPPAAESALRASGLFVLGDARDRMVVRCGPLAYRIVGGHRHMDQLAITLTVAGRPILIDPGQYAYTPLPDWRDRFRRSDSHNTVSVDGRPHCRVYRRSRSGTSLVTEERPHLERFEVTEDGGVFAGSHAGYVRLPGGGVHTRRIEFNRAATAWRVRDVLDLSGRHSVRWHFHLAVGVEAAEEGDGWRLVAGPAAVRLKWLTAGAPVGRWEEGWVAPSYGRREAAGVLVFEGTYDGRVEQAFLVESVQ